MAAAGQIPEKKLELGPIFVQTLGILNNHRGLLFSLALVGALPDLILAQIDEPSNRALGFYLVLGSIPQLFVDGLLTFAALRILAEGSATPGRVLAQLGPESGPWFSVGAVYLVVSLLGLFLLVVPGLIAMSALLAAVPACQAENLSLGDSLRRSAELTLGHRLRLCGLMLFPAIAFGLVQGVASGLEEAFWGGLRGGPLLVMDYLFSAFSLAFFGVLGGVVYVELLALREGGSVRTPADVF